jgi:hypothetical protein
MKNNTDKDTLSLKESAEFLELGYGVTYRIIVQLGHISYYDYGTTKNKKNIRVDKKELEEYKISKLVKAKT